MRSLAQLLGDKRLVPNDYAKARYLASPRISSFMALPPLPDVGYRGLGTMLDRDRTSLSSDWTTFIRSLYDALTSEIPPSQIVNGICDERAVPGTWDALFTVSGVPMNPLGHPPVGDVVKRALGWHSKQAQIIGDFLFAEFFKEWVPSSYTHLKIGTSSLPFWHRNSLEKRKISDLVLRHHEEIVNLTARWELDRAYSSFGALMAFFIQRRAQAESPKKERKAILADGSSITADKSVPGDDTLEFGATRQRAVWAANSTSNWILAYIDAGFRNPFLDRYRFTYKLQGADDLIKKMEGFIPVGVDVSQFDWSYPDFLLHKYAEGLDRRVGAAYAQHYLNLLYAPFFSPNSWRAGTGPSDRLWSGDPFDKEAFGLSKGLPSGIAPNPSLGKLAGTIDLLTMLSIVFDIWPTPEWISTLLQGRDGRFRLLNSADDALLLFRSEDDANRMRRALKEGMRIHFQFEEESPISFLGFVPYKPHPKSDVLAVAGNILSYFVNFYCNERSATSKMARPYPWTGRVSRIEDYSNAPTFGLAREIELELFQKQFGVRLDHLESFGSASEGVGGLPPGLHRLLEKPNRIFYEEHMVEDRDGLLTYTVPSEAIDSAFGHLMK